MKMKSSLHSSTLLAFIASFVIVGGFLYLFITTSLTKVVATAKPPVDVAALNALTSPVFKQLPQYQANVDWPISLPAGSLSRDNPFSSQ